MPTGTPRPYEIKAGLHILQRQAERDIPMDVIENAIRNGSERPLPGKGERGGVFRRYELRHEGRKIIVIAELCGKVCHLITTYEKATDHTRN